MWAIGNDSLEFKLFQFFDIFFSQHLEKIFVPDSPGRVTAAAFLVTHDGEVDPGLFENVDQSLSDFDVAVVSRAGATDPEKQICFFFCFAQNRYGQSFGPITSLLPTDRPGITVSLHVLEHIGYFRWELTFGENQVTA